MTTFASSVVAKMDEGLFIDGVEFPWHIPLDGGFEVEPGGANELTTVTVRFWVLGTVTCIDGKGRRQVVDRELGDVGEYARGLVRAGLAERVPWLEAS